MLGRLEGVKQLAKDRWQALCPIHDDHKPSLSISDGGDGTALLYCQVCGKNATPEILKALGLELRDLFLPTAGAPKSKRGPRRIVETYDYQNERGELLFQSVRYQPKDFRQRKPDGNGGWAWKLGDTPRVLYRLPELLKADPGRLVFVVEGEKDADRLATLDLVGTTNPMGVGKWAKLSDDSPLHGRHVAILPDNDPAGQAHAEQVARALLGKAADVRIVSLPVPAKGDVSDWLNNGGTADKLKELVQATPIFEPPTPKLQPGVYRGTDTGNADRLVKLHGEDLRHVPLWGRWLVWDGVRWVDDDTQEIGRRAEDTVKAIYAEAAAATDPEDRKHAASWATRSDSKVKIDAMLRCAEWKLSARPTDFDADGWALNVLNGTVDLRTGELRSHRRDDRFKKVSPIEFDPKARCPRWEQFLREIMDGHAA